VNEDALRVHPGTDPYAGTSFSVGYPAGIKGLSLRFQPQDTIPKDAAPERGGRASVTRSAAERDHRTTLSADSSGRCLTQIHLGLKPQAESLDPFGITDSFPQGWRSPLTTHFSREAKPVVDGRPEKRAIQ
jgi:hypothetical protein